VGKPYEHVVATFGLAKIAEEIPFHRATITNTQSKHARCGC